jgi:OFA family oxalate/formate antiporter-like MFS transporter
MLYALYCAAGIGAAFVYSGSIGSALKWFKDRRGLASGIIAAGFGGGTALFIPVISSIDCLAWYQSAFIATGIFQGLMIVVVAQFLRHPHAELCSPPRWPGRHRQASIHDARNASNAAVLHDVRDVRDDGDRRPARDRQRRTDVAVVGVDAAALTLAATLSPVANGTSRISWGWVSDHLGRENTMAIAFLLQAICLVWWLRSAISRWMVHALAGAGLLHVGRDLLAVPLDGRRLFRHPQRTSNYSVLYTAKGVASIIGGWFGAFLYEQTGTWSAAFTAARSWRLSRQAWR